MKRSILSILCIYLFSLSGLAAQVHFCDGTFESFSLGYDDASKCCCNDGNTCKTCCKNEQFKPTVSNHFSAKQQIVNPLTIVAVQVSHSSEPLITKPLNTGAAFKSLPHKDTRVPVFIKNCVYRL